MCVREEGERGVRLKCVSATCRAYVSPQVKDRSSVYSHTSRVRPNGAYLYEDFMPTDGTDVKVGTLCWRLGLVATPGSEAKGLLLFCL